MRRVTDRGASNERLWLAITNLWTLLSVLGPADFSEEGKSHVYGNEALGVLSRAGAPVLSGLLGGDETQIRRAVDAAAELPARQIYVRVQYLRANDHQHEAGRSLSSSAGERMNLGTVRAGRKQSCKIQKVSWLFWSAPQACMRG